MRTRVSKDIARACRGRRASGIEIHSRRNGRRKCHRGNVLSPETVIAGTIKIIIWRGPVFLIFFFFSYPLYHAPYHVMLHGYYYYFLISQTVHDMSHARWRFTAYTPCHNTDSRESGENNIYCVLGVGRGRNDDGQRPREMTLKIKDITLRGFIKEK